MVSFVDGGIAFATAILDDTGRAALTVYTLAAGLHPITATYTGDSTYSASTSPPLTQTVNPPNPPGPATHFYVKADPNSVVAGTPFGVIVGAADASGQIATGYTGTVHFTSSDRQATAPADYSFAVADNGVHTFTNGVTLKTASSQIVTATDTVMSSITGSAAVSITPAAADHFRVYAPATATAGQAFDVIVAALDPFGNRDTNYIGMVHFISSDPQATLPANYTFTPVDGGVHIFTNTGLGETTLITPGNQTLTATDTANGSITGSTIITVSPPPAPPPGRGANGPRNPPAITDSTPIQSGQQLVLLDRLFASLSSEERDLLFAGRRDRTGLWVLVSVHKAQCLFEPSLPP